MVDSTLPPPPFPDRSRAGLGPGPGPGPHLDLDALSALVDGALPPAEAAAARGHLTGCAACAADLGELRATVALLREMPRYRPRRSFVLGQEYATNPALRPVVDEGADAGGTLRFLPNPAVLRVATLAVAALLLLAVIGERTVGRLGPAPDAGGGQAPAVVEAPAEVQAPAPAADEAQIPPQQAPAAPTGLAAFAPTALPNAAVVARGAQEAAPARQGAPAVGGGAVQAPPLGDDETAAPAGTGTVGGASQAVDEGQSAATGAASPSPSPWRVAQIALGFVLLWLVVSLVGAGAVRRLRARPE